MSIININVLFSGLELERELFGQRSGERRWDRGRLWTRGGCPLLSFGVCPHQQPLRVNDHQNDVQRSFYCFGST